MGRVHSALSGSIPTGQEAGVSYHWPTVSGAIELLGLTMTEEQFLAAFRIVRHVKTFWLGAPMRFPVVGDLPQGFDLGLRDYQGNCDNCFLKSYAKLQRLIGDDPASADWWIEQEATITMESAKATAAGRRFVTEYSFADLKRFAVSQPLLIDDDLLDDDPSGDCTTEACGDETPAERRILQREYERSLAA